MNHLKNLLKDIADLEWQCKAWIENFIPNIFSSWEEIMCQFLDDIDVSELIEISGPEFNLLTEQIKLLSNLRNLMQNYSDSIPQFMCTVYVS